MAQSPKTEPPKTLMRWIVGTSLNYRFLVVTIGALLMVFGVATLPSTRVDAFPEFAPPRVVIQTACLGLSTSDVEQLVTVPLEQSINGAEGMRYMTSTSGSDGSSNINIIFDLDRDVDIAAVDGTFNPQDPPPPSPSGTDSGTEVITFAGGQTSQVTYSDFNSVTLLS